MNSFSALCLPKAYGWNGSVRLEVYSNKRQHVIILRMDVRAFLQPVSVISAAASGSIIITGRKCAGNEGEKCEKINPRYSFCLILRSSSCCWSHTCTTVQVVLFIVFLNLCKSWRREGESANEYESLIVTFETEKYPLHRGSRHSPVHSHCEKIQTQRKTEEPVSRQI